MPNTKQRARKVDMKNKVVALGFDKHNRARAVEVLDVTMKEVEKLLKSKGWKNIVFLEK